jgi:uncharacterized membrane protein YqjE
MNTLTYVKLGIVTLVILVIAVFGALGKLDAKDAVTAITATVGALVIALGIQNGGQSVGGALAAKASTSAAQTPTIPPAAK